MRVSVVKGDPGYKNVTHNINVYLDGNKVDRCITADDQLGLVVVYVFRDGKYVLNGDEVATEIMTGDVRIEIGG